MPIKKSTSNHRFFYMFMRIQCSHSDEGAQLSCHWRYEFPVLKIAMCYVIARQQFPWKHVLGH